VEDNRVVDADALASIAFFSGLAPETRRAVAPHVQRIEVAAGTELTTQGRPGYLFFVIESGRVTVVQDDRLLRDLGPGDFFGEIALLETGERTAFVRAQTPAKLIVLAQRDFERLLQADPAAAVACDRAMRERWAAPA